MRARKLARSKYGMGRMTEEDSKYWQSQAHDLNTELDLSFKYTDMIKGKWQRFALI